MEPDQGAVNTEEPDGAKVKIKAIEHLLGYSFKDKGILSVSLTRRSFNNDRLKFKNPDQRPFASIGETVIGFIIIKKLIGENIAPELITKKRNELVSRVRLSELARKVHLEKYVIFGKGEENDRIWKKGDILGECLEAIIGGVYVDSQDLSSCEAVLDKFLTLDQ